MQWQIVSIHARCCASFGSGSLDRRWCVTVMELRGCRRPGREVRSLNRRSCACGLIWRSGAGSLIRRWRAPGAVRCRRPGRESAGARFGWPPLGHPGSAAWRSAAERSVGRAVFLRALLNSCLPQVGGALPARYSMSAFLKHAPEHAPCQSSGSSLAVQR